MTYTERALQLRPVMEQAAQSLEDEVALTAVELFPYWKELVTAGKTVEKGFRFQHDGKLWRVEQPLYTFTEVYVPGSPGTESLFSIIDESHAGTLEDPIPYERNMRIEEGKYYTQYGVLYKCIKDSGIPLSHDLNQLIDHYVVEVVA